MNPSLQKRIKNEQNFLTKKRTLTKYIHRIPSTNNFTGFILGPKNSFYKKKIFRIKIFLPKNYPFKPPKVIFIDTIFHPNVKISDGFICVDILKENWKPMMTLDSVLEVVIRLLEKPNCESPLNLDAAFLLREGENEEFQKFVDLFYNLDC